MAKEIEINTLSLSKDIDTIHSHLNAINKDLGKMYDAVRVLDSMWDGPANAAFNEQFSKDRQDMKLLCDNIQRIIDCLHYAKNNYNSCEATVSTIISSIDI